MFTSEGSDNIIYSLFYVILQAYEKWLLKQSVAFICKKRKMIDLKAKGQILSQ
jgi:hypothetical protein